jgi:excisionase family DNA binding protein
MNDVLLTVEDMAGLLQVSTETVRRKARTGEVPAVRVGRLWRFDPEQIRAWRGRKTRLSIAPACPGRPRRAIPELL